MAQCLRISFLGSAGIPNRYGGFESFLEHCAPAIAACGHTVVVSCDGNLYEDHAPSYRGVGRVFLKVPANGGWSVLHDLLAFVQTFTSSSHLVLLGVSGGLWFPIFRLLCDLTGKRLIVNIDGIEWRRTKFGRGKRYLLRLLDWLAQRCAHRVIFDSEGLRSFLLSGVDSKAVCIEYPGDHVLRLPAVARIPDSALTICRIEPENNLETLIDGFLRSSLKHYTIIGNWAHSAYAAGLRQRYASEPRLRLLDPIYDPAELARHRESCAVYLHGHSVGGTNPSLVEMLFYDGEIMCFDISFNRYTAGDCAHYFGDAAALCALLDQPARPVRPRAPARLRFTAARIAECYIDALRHPA